MRQERGSGQVYSILNRVNGKRYIGQCRGDLGHRWSQHRCDAKRGSPCVIHRAIRKHGLDNFTFSRLCGCPLEDLDDMEAMFIEIYDSLSPAGYNVLPGSMSQPRVRAAKRQREDDSQLPLYVTHYFDYQNKLEGYRVRHTPSGQKAKISSMYLTMEEKLQRAVDFLAQAEQGLATKPAKVFKPRDLPPHVCVMKGKGRKDRWAFSQKGHKRVCFATREAAVEHAERVGS